ncbi:SpoIIE family protein phosphatase [Kibdelosporangium phytohabitans]|uniref:SpoIIE family protein phosphatase n=1 Tax=Kibdelosporangium phytohabitans TaxID=860235 RepID=UPI000A4E36AD|nr:SpoIIE family protein phosphatase [Kibdelosporangium phytohabitans]MBE1461756.1 signal transduction histidine kinase/DNA-binding response OmpR family regulator/serine phosphatase RsbU (regulator of sigma subunit) [Kibdelosporangium phytohabitans]
MAKDSAIPPDLAAAVALGGKTGEQFAAYDWASHPLGPVDSWPAETRSLVAVALTSRFPIVLWLGAEDLYLVYNDAYLPVLGEKHPAALGMPGQEVWWDIWDSIGPMLGGVVASGQSTWSDDLLLPVVTAGQPRERYFTFSYSPIITSSGAVDGVFCAVTETTERVLGQRRLSILNDFGAALMETRTVDDAVHAAIGACATQDRDLPLVAVYVEDPDSKTARLRASTPLVNGLMPSSLEALAPASATGSAVNVVADLQELVPSLPTVFPAGCPEQALILPINEATEAMARGALVVGVNPRQPLDNQYRGFCRLLADQLSAAFATAGSYQRERERADFLAELDRAKTTFLTNVSHEFRTPMTLLLGPLDDAIADSHDNPVQTERLDTARRNAQRLLRLVNSLLDFSRAEAGRSTAATVLVDVGTLTAQITSSFAELCQRAGIELIVACDPVVAAVDLGMWETIVLNLLSNAVKFTFTGSITVAVAKTGADTVSVTVGDTGSGIAAADLGRLFDRFYRAGNTRGRSVEGSGIGLSLVRELVELHDGTIEVDSELDVGTTVTIRLPVTAAQEQDVIVTPRPSDNNPFVAEAMQWLGTDLSTSLAPHQRTAGERRPLVLIADDNADMRRHIDRILSARWDTVVFGDGATALHGARRHRPDVIVTDVMMPALDGFGLVSAIRADPATAAIPVLMLSARAGQEATGEGFSSGADDYLAKPFSSHELVNRVAARISGAERERAERERNQVHTNRARFTARLGTAESIEDILTAFIRSPGTSLGADTVAIATTDIGSEQIRIHYAGTLPTELRDRYHTVAADAPLPWTDVIGTGQSLIIADTADADPRYEAIVRDWAGSVGAAAIYPLKDSTGTVHGSLALLWSAPRVFEPIHLNILATLSARTYQALDRVRAMQREHQIATDFQDHLLDLDRRSTTTVVAAHYEPTAEAMRVGGDWYLVAPLDDPGRVGVSVGDVVGHGLPAATVMSKLRSALTAAALTVAEPHAVLELVQRYAMAVPGATCSTVAYAVVDTNNHTISYACAGHPYPLVVTPTGATRYLEQGRRPPLAAVNFTNATPAELADFPPGSLLILYTDGLIERHGESLDEGFDRLAAAASRCRNLASGLVCAELLKELVPPGGFSDDVAILALRPAGVTSDSFVSAIPASGASTPSLRHRFRAWLADLGLPDMLVHDILLAVGEAVSNAIEHGSGSDAHKNIFVEAFADEHTISTTVSDTGRWSSDSSASHREAQRGRGLTLINGLSDRVATVRTSRGTHVTMHHSRLAAPEPMPITGAAR